MFDPFFGLLFIAALVAPAWMLIYWLNPKYRASRRKGFILLGCAVTAIAGFLFYAGPVLFVSNDGAMEIYIFASAEKADYFVQNLAQISKRYGMTPHIADMRESDGVTTHIIDASSFRLNLWGMNMPIDSRENPNECGRYSEIVHSDPGQYILRISKMQPIGSKQDIAKTTAKLRADLKAVGYEVRDKPAICSPLSRIRAPH